MSDVVVMAGSGMNRRGVDWANKASEQVLFRRTSDSVQPLAVPPPVNNDIAAAAAPAPLSGPSPHTKRKISCVRFR
jgi:hypothetical protein